MPSLLLGNQLTFDLAKITRAWLHKDLSLISNAKLAQSDKYQSRSQEVQSSVTTKGNFVAKFILHFHTLQSLLLTLLTLYN